MSHGNFVFGTAIGCMDGRVIPAVDGLLKKQYNIHFVDQPTVPGPEKFLAEADEAALASMRQKVEISVNGHGSRLIAVVAHQSCAGSPVTDEEHFAYIKKAVEIVKSWQLPAEVIGVWVTIHPETNKATAMKFEETLEIQPFTKA
jgi:carbonic anhydrase